MVSLDELKVRWERCRNLLREHLPRAGGVAMFSRLNIYYFTGTFGNGVLWLPIEGEPVLLCRRGCGRAELESPVTNIHSFYTYRDIETRLKSAGSPLTRTVAAEMNGLSWALGNSFAKYLSGHEFLPGDMVISLTRSKKTAWELEKLRKAGGKHEQCLVELLPPLLEKGMTELAIAHAISDLFFSAGHHGILRMENYGEEAYLGHISIGDSGNYPNVFNGALGLRGVHPAVPHMGSQSVSWQPGMPLSIDNAFTLEGYQTDKTQVYWLGDKSAIPDPVKSAHECCVEIQTWVAENLKPGVLPSELWAHSLEHAEKKGWAEGFMGLDRNKVSFVGHGIGLAIDEYPALAKGFDLPLEDGMVLAVEPKIGIRGMGMVGLENTFEVTPSGGRCLTGNSFDIICV